MQVKKYKLYLGWVFFLWISYQLQLSIRVPFTKKERIFGRREAPLFIYVSLLPKEKGLWVEGGYGSN